MFVVVLVLAAGLVVDLGLQRVAARDAQADADLIALDMARLADGRTLAQMAGVDHKPLVDALTASANRNGIAGTGTKDPDPANTGKLLLLDGGSTRLEVQWGWFSVVAEPNCGVQTQVRGEADAPWFAACTAGWQVPNAARVTVHDAVDFVLLPIHPDGPRRGPVTRQAFARHGPEDLVSFRLGSYLLDGVQNGALNNLFGTLLGTSVNLQAVHYNGLLLHDVTIADIAAFHGISGSPTEVLSQQVTFNQVGQAVIDSLRQGGGGTLAEADIQALEAVFVSAHAISNAPIRLRGLVAVDPTDPDSAMDAELTALDLLQTAAHLAQCNNGQCHGIALQNMFADVGGVAVIGTPSLTVVEGPRVYVGNEVGGTLQTSQVSSLVNLDLTTVPEGPVGSCKLLGLNCLLSGLLGNLLGRVGSLALREDMTGEITVNLVGGSARIQDLCYNEPATRDLDLATLTSLYDVEARVELRFKNTLLLGLGETNFRIALEVSNTAPTTSQPVTFTDPDHMGPETIGQGSIGLSGLNVAVEVNGTAIGGLSALEPLFSQLNSSSTMRAVINSYANLLTGTIVQRTDQLVGALAQRLGINASGADLDARFINCGTYGVQLVG